MRTQFLKRFLEADPDGGSGGTSVKQPTLAELDDPNYKPPVVDVAEAQRLADAEAARVQEELKAEAFNEDGTLKEGYLKDDEGKLSKDPNFKPAGDKTEGEGNDDSKPAEENDDDPLAFWEDVDKLHGTKLVVEYPENVDPLSPEGVYHREKAVAAQAVEKFEGYLKVADPRSYAYMLHRQAGGDDDSFFSNKTFSLPEYDAFKESADMQSRLYKSSLLSKGLDEDTAQMAIDKAIKDGVLFDKADAEYKKAEQSHAAELLAIENANKQAEQEYTAAVNTISQQISSAVNEGKGMNFIIPDTDKAGFAAFVKQQVEYDSREKKFLIVQKVGDELTRQLESMYLLYKKGDLNGLIKRKAESKVVSGLKRAIDKSKQSNNGNGGADDTKPVGHVPLGSL